MDILYCFDCKAKIAAEKRIVGETPDGKQRDFCKTCYEKAVTANRVQPMKANTGFQRVKELHDSRYGSDPGAHKPDTDRLRKPTGGRGPSPKSSSPGMEVKRISAGAGQPRRKSDPDDSGLLLRGKPKRTTRTIQREESEEEEGGSNVALIIAGGVVFLVLVLGGLFILTQNKNKPNDSGQPETAADGGGATGSTPTVEQPDPLADVVKQLHAIQVEEKSPMANAASILGRYNALKSRLENSPYELEVEQRIIAIETIQQINAQREKDARRIQGSHAAYQTAIVLEEIGPWKERLEEAWKSAETAWNESAGKEFREALSNKIKQARIERRYDAVFADLDAFIATVDDFAGAKNAWRQLAIDSKAELEAYRERNPEGSAPEAGTDTWTTVNSDEGFAALKFGGNGEWKREGDAIVVTNVTGDTWAVVDVSALARYDMEIRLQGEMEGLLTVLRMRGETIDLENDLVWQLNTQNFRNEPHTLRFNFIKEPRYVKCLVDGVDNSFSGQDYSAYTGKFVLVFRGKTNASVQFWRYKPSPE